MDMNRANPYSNLTCSLNKFWDPRKKQCIRRILINYKVNQYFKQQGLDMYFYDRNSIPEEIAAKSKDMKQHPEYLKSKPGFMASPAQNWLRSDVAVLSVKHGFFAPDLLILVGKFRSAVFFKLKKPLSTSNFPPKFRIAQIRVSTQQKTVPAYSKQKSLAQRFTLRLWLRQIPSLQSNSRTE